MSAYCIASTARLGACLDQGRGSSLTTEEQNVRVATLTVPENLAEAAASSGQDKLRRWVAELPQVITELSERWSLRVGDPYQPGGHCSWVAPARDARGADLVLKVGWAHTEAIHEAAALRLWDGRGAVTLHACHDHGQTSALLLERCLPGTPLREAAAEPDQDVIVAGLLRQLWRQPPAGHPFRPLLQMCDQWADRFERHKPPGLDPGLAREGIAMFRMLPGTAGEQVVLCTDLHAGNILAARRAPWLVIDPKPYVGDPAYDVLQHMLNCDGRLASDPDGLVRRMAGLLDLDPGRLRMWLFARCVQESAGWPELRSVAARIAPG